VNDSQEGEDENVYMYTNEEKEADDDMAGFTWHALAPMWAEGHAFD
jgi:hypothetical protein